MSKEKILWFLFLVDSIVILFHLLGSYGGIEFAKSSFIIFLALVLPALILFIHSIWVLSAKRALFFVFLACLIGFLSEFIGLNSGIIFGGHYVYQQRSWMLFDVPISVILYWAVFTYLGYSIVNSFLYWKNKSKPTFAKHNFLQVPILCLQDGLIVTAIDLFMDPLQVNLENWTWIDKGPYFGVPIGNFVGWFIVVVIITGIFRSFEYFNPQKKTNIPKKILLIPVLGYAAIWFSFVLLSVEAQMYNLAVIGTLLMLPTVFINLYLFHKNRFPPSGWFSFIRRFKGSTFFFEVIFLI